MAKLTQINKDDIHDNEVVYMDIEEIFPDNGNEELEIDKSIILIEKERNNEQ